MTHIDILLITYNRPQLLALTLKSLAEQTYSDFTVHVVDNGSQAAIDPAMAPAGLDIRWTRKEENQRQTDIGNAFIQAHRPPLFVSLADDDVWSPRLLETAALLFEQNADMESLGIGFTHFDHERGQPSVSEQYLRSFTGELQRFDGPEAGYAYCNSWSIGPKKHYLLPRMGHASLTFVKGSLIQRTIECQGELLLKPFGDIGYVGCCFNTPYIHYLDLPLGVIGKAPVREMNGALAGGRQKWQREVPYLEHSPLRACSFVNMGTDNHLKVLHRNGISAHWDCTLQMEFFLRHIDEICADAPDSEEMIPDLNEVVPLAIETCMQELKLEGDESRQRCKDEVLNFIKQRCELHAKERAQREAAANIVTASPGEKSTRAHQDIVAYAAWQEKTIALPLLGLGENVMRQQRSGAHP